MDWIKNYRIAREIFNPSLATATFEVNFIQKKTTASQF
jgi:hypothetical protein